MNRLDASPQGTIAAAPQRPSERNDRSVLRRSSATTATAMLSAAKTARSATCVAGAACTSRCRTPAVDQTIAAVTMTACPAR